MLDENLKQIRQRIHAAAVRVGRDPAAITLVGVTKTVAAEVIQQAISLGLADIGENHVQEALEKQNALGSRFEASGKSGSLQPKALSLEPKIRWHLIGHLQKNKAKRAVELFDVIHSVDSLKLVDELERHAASFRLQASGQDFKALEVFVQVNVSGEATKFGCPASQAKTLVGAVRQRPHLRFRGLMTIAPYTDNPEAARPYFRQLRQLRDEVVSACSLQPAACNLSMGMSHDFEAAIEEGADIVRIGTAIFGDRKPQA